MRGVDVNIENPCGEDWDAMRPDLGGRWCDQCRHRVHDLSGMGEAEARAFLAAPANDDACVAYLEDAAGELVFARSTTLVPLARVRARARGRVTDAAKLASAASLAALLSACTPHGEPDPALEVEVSEQAPVIHPPTTVIPAQPAVPCEPPAAEDSEPESSDAERPRDPRGYKKGKLKRTAGIRIRHPTDDLL